MAVVISAATGNFLTAATWALVDGTSYSNSETTNATVPTAAGATARSSGFTPGAITIDAIAVKIGTRSGTTGTMTARLWNNTDSVLVTNATCTINCSDLPASAAATFDGGWIVFAFGTSVLLVAGKSYMVELITSSVNQVIVFAASGNNWSRALRTTTAQAPAAGDDMIIAGEHTGAGTGNSFVVTMDQTAATDYGSNTNSLVTPALAVCKRGTIKWKDTSAANPYLRLSGHAIVYNGGTLNIGVTGGSEIPRDSTAILEFDPAADGDMGLVARNGSTVNLQGLSRTSGKNVVSCKLNANTSVNVVQSASIGTTNLNIAAVGTTLDSTGTSLGVGTTQGTFNQLLAATDTVTNANHRFSWASASVAGNTSQVFSIWVKRGSGTNNRYIRLQHATTASVPATNGFYADFDLQAGTVGTCTALGNGTATSASITAFGGGFICTIIGAASSGASVVSSVIAACNSSGGVTYAGDATQNFVCGWAETFTASAAPTDLTVDTDTGWLAGDVVAVASTTRDADECEVVKLGSNAGASTLPLSYYPVNYHDGVSPVQAEVILLTRNVKVRSTSPTIMAYVATLSGSTVDIDWTEFAYLGDNASQKRGIEIENLTGSFVCNTTINYSSMHDFEDFGLYLSLASGGTFTNLNISYNTMWNLASITGPACQTASASIATNYTIDNNILIRTGSGNGWTLSDVGGTFTNNTVVGAASIGIQPSEQNTIGTFSGNAAHSNVGAGFTDATAALTGVLGTLTSWRNGGTGLTISAAMSDLSITSPVMFGNTTDNILVTGAGGDLYISNIISNGDTSFSTTNGLRFSSSGAANKTVIDNGDFSTITGIKTAHTNDININPAVSPYLAQTVLRNTKLGASVEVATPSSLSNNGFVSSQKHDQTAGNHMTWMRNGKIQTDASVFNTAAPSLLMTPTSASLKLESAPQFQGMKVAVANGATANVSVYIRKSASYNGNQPRLIQKANPALGQNSDVVLATYSAGTGAWNQISGTTSAATDDGAWEIIVDCDGTAGAINVDDFAVA